MADEIITKQELIDAKPDVKNLGEAANGNETGIVTPRYGEPYLTAPAAIKKIIDAGGFRPFSTEVELKAYTPTTSPVAAYAFDTKKVWMWEQISADGVEPKVFGWLDEGTSALDQAKLYTNLFVKDVTTLSNNTSLNAANKFGHWFLSSTNTYVDLPTDFLLDDNCVLRVLQASGGFFEQQLFKLNKPDQVWKRKCLLATGEGAWRTPGNRYLRSYDSIDPKTISIAGTYVVTSPTNMPTGFAGAALLIVENFGNFTIRTITRTDNLNSFKQVNNTDWVSTQLTNITSDKLAIDFAYRGLFANGDFNTLINEGNYLVSGVKVNGPSWMTDTAIVDVKRLGNFVIQRATSQSTIETIAQRRGVASGGIWSFEAWARVGVPNGSGGASSLAGKRIAFIGDSIVEGGDYPERIGTRYGATVYKFGFGGCRAGRYTASPLGYDKQCMYNIAKCINSGDYSSLIAGAQWTRDNANDDNTPQANAMAALNWMNVDILVIAFGTNDWTGTPLGTDLTPDSTGTTYKGAMCFIVEQILSKYPHLQIVLEGMSFRLRADGTADPAIHSDNTANWVGKYLVEYQQALLDVGEKYHIPVHNMYKFSGINSMNYTSYLRDGVHPISSSGYQHWANKIGSFLNASI
ncbi:SGNH/GDSL hydrolase family protein [Acinetobacter soli]|uniref:SGNH/GDSL hydrolase family protein n=1 Tax=Acinetobacter soli TaxID=487316 RepID=UPI003B9E0F90